MTTDRRRARLIRDLLGRPWGHRGPTPEDAWRQRHVTAAQRRHLQATVNRYRQEELDRAGWKTFCAGETVDDLQVHLAEPLTARRVRLLIAATNGESPSLVEFDLFWVLFESALEDR